MLFQLPRQCRVFCAINPALEWGWPEVIANKANYLLDVLVWQNTKDGKKKQPTKVPKPFMPPFMKKAMRKDGLNKDSELHTVDDIRDILAKRRQ